MACCYVHFHDCRQSGKPKWLAGCGRTGRSAGGAPSNAPALAGTLLAAPWARNKIVRAPNIRKQIVRAPNIRNQDLILPKGSSPASMSGTTSQNCRSATATDLSAMGMSCPSRSCPGGAAAWAAAARARLSALFLGCLCKLLLQPASAWQRRSWQPARYQHTTAIFGKMGNAADIRSKNASRCGAAMHEHARRSRTRMPLLRRS